MLGLELTMVKKYRRSVRVKCPDMPTWRIWARGLTYAIAKARARSILVTGTGQDYFRNQFNQLAPTGWMRFPQVCDFIRILDLHLNIW